VRGEMLDALAAWTLAVIAYVVGWVSAARALRFLPYPCAARNPTSGSGTNVLGYARIDVSVSFWTPRPR
jgi:hypothetical protein